MRSAALTVGGAGVIVMSIPAENVHANASAAKRVKQSG